MPTAKLRRDHASRTYDIFRQGCNPLTLSPDFHHQQENEIQYLVWAGLELSTVLEWHSDCHILRHAADWTALGCCRCYRNLRELGELSCDSRCLGGCLGPLHIYPSNPDCVKVTDLPTAALVHPRYFWDCYLVGIPHSLPDVNI